MGALQLSRYIADLPRASVTRFRTSGAFSMARKGPGFDGKNWRENVVRVAKERRFALITFAATSEQLDECLRTKIAQDRAKKIRSIWRRPSAPADSRSSIPRPQPNWAASDRSFGCCAHPLLRPVVVDYQLAAESLARKKSMACQATRRQRRHCARRSQLRMSEVDVFR